MKHEGYVIAFDPGDTTGIALFNESRQVVAMDQVKMEDIADWWVRNVSDKKLDAVVVEDFVLFSKRAKQQAGSKMKASQGIGMIRALTATHASKPKIHMQPSNILPIGIKLSGISMPHTHSETHKWCAFVHGFYWLHKHGQVETELERNAREKREANGRA